MRRAASPDRHTGNAPPLLARRFPAHHERGLRLRHSGGLGDSPDRGRGSCESPRPGICSPSLATLRVGPVQYGMPHSLRQDMFWADGRACFAEIDIVGQRICSSRMSSENGRNQDPHCGRAMAWSPPSSGSCTVITARGCQAMRIFDGPVQHRQPSDGGLVATGLDGPNPMDRTLRPGDGRIEREGRVVK